MAAAFSFRSYNYNKRSKRARIVQLCEVIASAGVKIEGMELLKL